MARTRKTIRAGAVKVEMDTERKVTTFGGAALLNLLLRKLGLLRILKKHVAKRGPSAQYEMVDTVYGLIAGLVLGGRGIAAAQRLRQDSETARVLGLEACVPEEATMFRCLEELAGLSPRCRSEAYEAAGPRLERLSLWGEVEKSPKLRRKRGGPIEWAMPEAIERMVTLGGKVAATCLRVLRRQRTRIFGYVPLFGDASDLEVEGNCFDGACKGRDGKKQFRWFTLMLGPIVMDQELTPGSTDEGKHIPSLIDRLSRTLKKLGLARMRLLGLFDSAYFERAVVSALNRMKTPFIIGANQMRNRLQEIASEQPAFQWRNSGEDQSRGWIASQVCAFWHLPQGWENRVTIVARRWREVGDLPHIWHYAFVGTNLEKADLPGEIVKSHGYEESIWMLYGTKQGHENHYKQLLSDIELHHPPSSRMGVNQVFYALGTIASNLSMVLRHRALGEEPSIDGSQTDPTGQVAPEQDAQETSPAGRGSMAPRHDRGMCLSRVREKYFRIAATLIRSGRQLVVRLAAGGLSLEHRNAWMAAWKALEAL